MIAVAWTFMSEILVGHFASSNACRGTRTFTSAVFRGRVTDMNVHPTGVAAFKKEIPRTWQKNCLFPGIFIADRNIQRLLTHGRSCPCGSECA